MRTAICSVVLTLFLVRCATVTRGPMQRIRVASKPTGASVKLRDCGGGSTDSAKTPDTVFVNRRATNCSLTFSLPEYGNRTVPLFRRALARIGPPEGFGEMLDSLLSENDPISGTVAVVGGVVGGTIWGISRGFDGLTGANYQQNRSTVVVDFNNPVRNVAGQYAVMAVNGMELPADTWSARKGKCRIWTNAGSVILEESGRWRSIITEQQLCGKRTHAPIESKSFGVYTVRGDNILLESEGGVASGVFLADRLELTMADEESQRAVYSLRLPLLPGERTEEKP